MAEGFESYHVPQQSRRDKLRVVAQAQIENHYLHSSSSSSASAATMAPFHHDLSLLPPSDFLSFPHSSSLQLNPTPIQDVSYHHHAFRFFDHHHRSLHGAAAPEVVVYRPEPSPAAHVASSNITSNAQGLSLSLSSSHPHQTNFPLELNLPRYESSDGFVVSAVAGGGSGANELSRSSVPLGPFTGYASILKGSRFLKPAQQLLEELSDVGKGIYADKFPSDQTALIDPLPLEESLGESGINVDDPQSCSNGGDNTRKSRLISMLHEVYRRYKQYYQQIQAVVASFESVAGLSNAAPFVNLAFKSMSKHFRNLKNALIDQLQFATKSYCHMNYENDETRGFGNSGRGHFGQRPAHTGIVEHQPVWRPQRGLPERAVNVLRAWLFDHFLHPYPTDTDKLMLAKQTGLSRSQVSNWFINARVRLWKPMVEEIHMLETQEAQKASRKEHNPVQLDDQLPVNKGLACEDPSTSTPKISDFPLKRTRNMAGNHVRSEQPMHLSYDDFSEYPDLSMAANSVGGSNGVQLTLGLHQNKGVGLSEPFPIHAAQRFGLEANGEGYVIGGNRPLVRNIIGGQLVRDFVG